MTAGLAAAVGTVRPGDTVWLGNFGAQLFAVGDELIRQGLTGLHVVLGSGGLVLDRLIGAGVAEEVTFAHCWSAVGPAPAWEFRRAWQEGAPIRWHELSLGVLSAALSAAARGLPFAPVVVSPESGYRAEDWTAGMLAEVASPFGAAVVVRALPVDVAFVHASLAEPGGDTHFGYAPGEAVLAAQAARRVVVVAEEVGRPAGVRARGVDLPGLLVDTVVEVPGAAARPRARFGVTFSRLGLHPGGGCTHFLVRALGPQRALSILLDGATLSAEDAEQTGLVLKIAEDPLAEALETATRWAALDPGLVADLKRAVAMAAALGPKR